MDAFKRAGNKEIGPGGRRCSCCWARTSGRIDKQFNGRTSGRIDKQFNGRARRRLDKESRNTHIEDTE